MNPIYLFILLAAACLGMQEVGTAVGRESWCGGQQLAAASLCPRHEPALLTPLAPFASAQRADGLSASAPADKRAGANSDEASFGEALALQYVPVTRTNKPTSIDIQLHTATFS
ncbi:hypothetical protein [Bacterioplanes sanyensis]|nr:hypothetical protein [Bacterioplanes sanyensis]